MIHIFPLPPAPPLPPAEGAPTVNTLGHSFLGLIESMPPGKLTGFPHDVPAPDRPRVAFLLPFELVSVHLLVVLIGAAYLARAKRRHGGGA